MQADGNQTETKATAGRWDEQTLAIRSRSKTSKIANICTKDTVKLLSICLYKSVANNNGTLYCTQRAGCMHAAAKLPTVLWAFVAQEGHESDGNEPLVSPGRTFSPISAGKRLLKPTPRKLPRKVEKDVREKRCKTVEISFGVALEMNMQEALLHLC